MDHPQPTPEEAFDKLQSIEREHEARQALRQTERQKNLYWIWQLDVTRENIVRHLQSLDQGEKDERDAIVKQRQLWMESTKSVQLVTSECVRDTDSHGSVDIADHATQDTDAAPGLQYDNSVNMQERGTVQTTQVADASKEQMSDIMPAPAPIYASSDAGTNIETSTVADLVSGRAGQSLSDNTPAYHGLLCATPSRHSRVPPPLANSATRSLTPQEFRQLPMIRQLLKEYPCIILVDFTFYELSCKLCNANATAASSRKGTAYFRGRAGVIDHLKGIHQKSWHAINEQGLVATRKMPMQEVKSIIWGNHTIPIQAAVVSKKRKVLYQEIAAMEGVFAAEAGGHQGPQPGGDS